MKLTQETAPRLFERLSFVNGGIEFDGEFFPYGEYLRMGEEGYVSELYVNIGKGTGKRHEIFKLIEYTHAERVMKYFERHGYDHWLSPLLHHTDIRQDYLKICNACGSLYYCQAKWAKYCCQDCHPKITREEKRRRDRVNYWRNRRKPIPVTQCLHCGKEFQPVRSTKKTCSDKCRKALSRKTK